MPVWFSKATMSPANRRHHLRTVDCSFTEPPSSLARPLDLRTKLTGPKWPMVFSGAGRRLYVYAFLILMQAFSHGQVDKGRPTRKINHRFPQSSSRMESSACQVGDRLQKAAEIAVIRKFRITLPPRHRVRAVAYDFGVFGRYFQ